MSRALVVIGTAMLVLSVLGFTGVWQLIRGASWGLMLLGLVLLAFAWIL